MLLCLSAPALILTGCSAFIGELSTCVTSGSETCANCKLQLVLTLNCSVMVSSISMAAHRNKPEHAVIMLGVCQLLLLIHASLVAVASRGIDVVRNKIKMFAQKKVTLPPGRHKIVILDEADR